MTYQLTTYRRSAGVALLAGAALTVAGCVWTAAAQASGHVSHHLFRFPLSQGAAVAFAVFAACTHLLILAGVVWLRRSGFAAGRWSTPGLGCVIAGTALLFACELGSILVINEHNGTTGTSVVYTGFALASVLSVFGMIATGASTLRHTNDDTWRRNALLSCGLLSLIVIPLQFTSAIWLGIAIYALGYGVLGTALLTEPVGRRDTVTQAA